MLVTGRRDHAEPPPPPTPQVSEETPWLTPEAAAEVIGPGGSLGPLFTGVFVGGTPPLPEVRARIAAFARAHDVDIDLEIVDDEVAAIRFEVTYGGCCGYEAADRLAARIQRPTTGGGCSGGPEMWVDDWVAMVEDGLHVRVRVRVNRLVVRWQPMATLPEILERVDRMLGSRDGGDQPDRAYRLDVAYPVQDYYQHEDVGLDVVVRERRVAEVSFSIRAPYGEPDFVRDTVRSHWGTPHADRFVVIRHEPDITTVTLRAR